MYALVEKLSNEIKSFLDQRDSVALSVASTENETPVIWKILESVGEESSSELFWQFEMPFVDTRSYVESIFNSFRQRHEMVRLLQPQNGLVEWPSIPEELFGSPFQTVAQLKKLMTFSRELLPSESGFLSIWIFYPFEIKSQFEFAGFLLELLQHEFPFPWLHGLRVIFREGATDRTMSTFVDGMPRVSRIEVDFSPSAMSDAIEHEIDDESLPLARRMQGLLMSAGMDFSHRRYEQALDKYQILFKFHGLNGDRGQLACALNGIGEVQQAIGQQEAARDSFLAALIPATEGEHPAIPVLTNILINLSNWYEQHSQWPEVEQCTTELYQLGALQRNPQLKVIMLERLGSAQYQQGKQDEAIASWSASHHVAYELELKPQQPSVLKRLRDVYLEKRDFEKAKEYNEQLNELAQGGYHG